MRALLLALMASFVLAGCAAWNTPSVYSNQSTAQQTQVNAQGSAASVAAAANVSASTPNQAQLEADALEYDQMANIMLNCPNCTDSQKAFVMNYVTTQHSQRDEWQGHRVLDDTAKSDLSATVNWRLNRALDQALFRLLQDSY